MPRLRIWPIVWVMYGIATVCWLAAYHLHRLAGQ